VDKRNYALIPVPYCFKSSLKILHISNFHGYYSSISFIEFLLKNARVLEEIKITCSNKNIYYLLFA